MSDLVRKQIYITRDQDGILKTKSALLGISEAGIIREALDREMHRISFPRRSSQKWQEELRFIRTRITVDGERPNSAPKGGGESE